MEVALDNVQSIAKTALLSQASSEVITENEAGYLSTIYRLTESKRDRQIRQRPSHQVFFHHPQAHTQLIP